MINGMKATILACTPPLQLRHRNAWRAALAAIVLGSTLLGGCVYRLPIQQGNYLSADTLAQVKPGMTRTQVRYLLGTPMVPGGFDDDRWDYQYYLKLRRLQTPRTSHATVYFRDELVDRVESELLKADAGTSATQSAAPPPRS